MFYQDELVARGVKMEGWSVEDNGEGVCFNVFVYNVQPGISICHADGTSSRIAQEETTDPSAQKIYGNRRSKIYHCPEQAAYEEMKDSPNLVIFDSEEQAQAAGLPGKRYAKHRIQSNMRKKDSCTGASNWANRTGFLFVVVKIVKIVLQ